MTRCSGSVQGWSLRGQQRLALLPEKTNSKPQHKGRFDVSQPPTYYGSLQAKLLSSPTTKILTKKNGRPGNVGWGGRTQGCTERLVLDPTTHQKVGGGVDHTTHGALGIPTQPGHGVPKPPPPGMVSLMRLGKEGEKNLLAPPCSGNKLDLNISSTQTKIAEKQQNGMLF